MTGVKAEEKWKKAKETIEKMSYNIRIYPERCDMQGYEQRRGSE